MKAKRPPVNKKHIEFIKSIKVGDLVVVDSLVREVIVVGGPIKNSAHPELPGIVRLHNWESFNPTGVGHCRPYTDLNPLIQE
jgi:hypothetical protein